MNNFDLPSMASDLQRRTVKLMEWQSDLDHPFAQGSVAEMDSSKGRAGFVPTSHAGVAIHLASDMLSALSKVSTPEPTWSSLVLARAVLYNAVHILWLAGPADSLTRQQRGAIDAFEDNKNAVNLDDAASPDDNLKNTPVLLTNKRKSWLVAEFGRLRISLNNEGGPTGIASLKIAGFLKNEVCNYLPESDSGRSIAAESERVWRILSGIDHGYVTAMVEAGGRAYGKINTSLDGASAIVPSAPNGNLIAITLLIYSVALERFSDYVGCKEPSIVQQNPW